MYIDKEKTLEFNSNRLSSNALHGVGVTGFEPATTWSQTRRATGLRYAPNSRAKLVNIIQSCKFIFVASALSLSVSGVSAQSRELLLKYDRPAEFFEEALVIGNGKIGATVYGNPSHEHLSLNDITLWTGGPDTLAVPDHSRALAEVRRCLDRGDYKAAEEAQKQLQGHYSENYQPLGDLLVDFGLPDAPTGYQRQLDLRSAIATVSFRSGGYDYRREYFVSSPDSVIVMVLSTDNPAGLDFSVSLSSQLPHKVSGEGSAALLADGNAAATSLPCYYGAVPDSLKHTYADGHGMRFRTDVRVSAPKGTVTVADNSIKVSGAPEALLVVGAETSFNGFDRDPVRQGKDCRAIASRNATKAVGKSAQTLRDAHLADYGRLFGRVDLDLGATAPAMKALTTDRQLKLYTDSAAVNPELEALYFQYGRYLLISCSRTPGVPANLQGLWNEKILPPWSSNYTTNINLQENYWPVEVTNLSELHTPLLDYIKGLSVTGARSAKAFYGVRRGWNLGQNSDIWAMTNPVGLNEGGPLWANWTMGGAWVATHIWEHYAFTLDRSFLERNYVYLKGAAEFCLDWLVERDGVLTTSPGTSPENEFLLPGGGKVATSTGPTSDIAMIRECLEDALKASRIVGDKMFADEIEVVLPRLAPYKIGAKGQLQEWAQDFGEAEPTHRHQSHLFGLYPGHHISPFTTPELADACARTLELRGFETTGWSAGWRVNIFARLLDSDRAYRMYRRLLRYVSPDGYNGPDARRGGGTYPNLLDAHSPFQIDGNFGGTAGVAEMLLQSDGNVIRLLPTLPQAWKRGTVRGLRARGAVTVDIFWDNGRVVKAVLTPDFDTETVVTANGESRTVRLRGGRPETLRF